MKVRRLNLLLALFLCSALPALSLFEDGQASLEKDNACELNGYLRSSLYLGKVPERNLADIKSGYGEFSLKLRASKPGFGDAHAEVRFRRGMEFDASLSEFNLREAYVNAYIGPLDFRVGHQIVVWGRADGINPTDNITPKNMLARSPVEDDRREANFLLRSFLHLHPLRLELIWVPFFKSSVIPTSLFPFPPGLTLDEPVYPGARIKNGAAAARLNLELPSFDGSLSYFNGHLPFPGLNYRIGEPAFPSPSVSIFPQSYRIHVFGADFSTTIAGSFGIRGEVAYKKPHKDYRSFIYIPNPELHYVLGLDREFPGNFSIILQYIGRFVFDYYPLAQPLDPMAWTVYEIALKNRLLAFQQYEVSHSLSSRLGWNLLNETLNLELVWMANFTSRENLFRPRLAYDITDALTFTVGGEAYFGPHDTLFGLIDSHLSSVFAELRISF